jgi:hypothetical protein
VAPASRAAARSSDTLAAVLPPPAVYQLLGFPGTGKYTVAKELTHQLVAAGRTAKLLDNHATANLIFDVVPPAERLSSPSMAHIGTIRRAVLTAIEELSPPDWSFVFTNWIPPTSTLATVERHRQLAAQRGVPFVIVVLECERDEILLRVGGDDRAARLKLVDVARAAEVIDGGALLPDWPGLLHLDVTSRTPEQAAAWIVDHTPRDE